MNRKYGNFYIIIAIIIILCLYLYIKILEKKENDNKKFEELIEKADECIEVGNYKNAEKIENENVEIMGEIDELKMKEANFFQKIKNEYGLEIENYEFLYKLSIKKSEEKIRSIEIQINLKLEDRYEINETNMIKTKY